MRGEDSRAGRPVTTVAGACRCRENVLADPAGGSRKRWLVGRVRGPRGKRSVFVRVPGELRYLGPAANLEGLSGETSPAINARSCDGMNGFGRKCHPSLRTSMPPVNPDISNTLMVGRCAVILIANSTPVIPGIWKSDKRR